MPANARTERRTPSSDAALTPTKPRVLTWNAALVIFMRLVAVAWVLKGLASWAVILGVAPGEAEGFEGRRLAVQATTIYFSVIDLIAAIGLWLASSWGAVIWLIAVVTEFMLAQVFPTAFQVSPARASLLAALMAAHLVLSWLAANEAQR